MLITKQINDVVASINPAIFQSLGPSGQLIEFTSLSGTGASVPITITFDKPINTFSIKVVGLTFSGHTTKVYNTNGQLITTIQTDPKNPDSGFGGSIETVNYTDNSGITKVELFPPNGDYIGYSELFVVANQQIPAPPVPQPTPQTPSPQPAPTPTPLPPPVSTPNRYVNLSDVIFVDTLTIDRPYVKGSLRAIPSGKFTVKNTSSEVEVQVSISGLAGVSFEPSNFTLPTNGTQEITVNFDIATIDSLPEGINTVNAAINLSSTNTTFNNLPIPTPVPAPLPPTVQTPVVNIQTRTIYIPLIPLPPQGTSISNPSEWALWPIRQAEYATAVQEFNTAISQGAKAIQRPDGRTSFAWNEGTSVASGDIIRGAPVGTANTSNTSVLVNPIQPVLLPPPPEAEMLTPVLPVLIPATPLTPYVDGTNGKLNYGNPPVGWVQDPFGGAWYPPDDPYVLRDFDRAARNGVTQITTPQPILLAPSTPQSAPPAPTSPTFTPPETFGGSSTQTTSTGQFNIDDQLQQFLI